MRIKLITITALLLVPAFMKAQELHTQYQFLGFSDDLKYCGFEVYASDNDEAFSIMYFIDVDKNDYATHPVRNTIALSDSSDGEKVLGDVRKATANKAGPFLAQYKIGGRKTGTLIEFKGESNGFGIQYEPEQEFTVKDKKYKLILSSVGTGVTNFAGDEEQMVVAALEHNGNRKTLQQATKVPKSWGSIIGYQPICVYYLDNKLAVFIECLGPGFEGVKSTLQMIVTGVLD